MRKQTMALIGAMRFQFKGLASISISQFELVKQIAAESFLSL